MPTEDFTVDTRELTCIHKQSGIEFSFYRFADEVPIEQVTVHLVSRFTDAGVHYNEIIGEATAAVRLAVAADRLRRGVG